MTADALPSEVVELSTTAEEFLSWLAVERGRAANTLSAYRRDLLGYEAFLRARRAPTDEVGENLVQDYLAFLRASGRKPTSVARALAAVRGFHRFCLDEGHSEADPTGDVERAPVPLGLPKALTEDEIAALLGAVVGSDPPARRDRAILEVLYGTGLRISELVGLSLADLALPEGTLRAFGKGSKERLVPVGRCARRALAEWLEPSGRGALVPRRWARRNDAEAVFEAARAARERALAGEGPTLIEAVTMRMHGHAAHDDMKYVPKEQVEEWRKRDPVDRQEARLRSLGVDVDEVRAEIQAEIDAATEEALRAPMPDPASAVDGVFCEGEAEPLGDGVARWSGFRS